MASPIKQSFRLDATPVGANLNPANERVECGPTRDGVIEQEAFVMKRLIIVSVLALMVSGVTADARGFGGGGFRGGGFRGGGGFHGARVGYRGGFHGHRGAVAGGYGRYGYRGGYGRYGYRPYAVGAAALGVGAAAAYGARSYGGCGPYHYYDANAGGCVPY